MTSLLRHAFALLIGCGMLWIPPASAVGITCSQATMTPISFGTVNPQSSLTQTTATLTYKCANSGGFSAATVCFELSEPGSGPTNPRVMTNSSHTLQFQLYQDAGYSTVWGNQATTPVTTTLSSSTPGTITGSITVYAQVLAGQTTAFPSGTPYADDYLSANTSVSVNSGLGSVAPSGCGSVASGVTFPFNVTATVQQTCSVTANNLSLNSVAAGTVPASNSATLSVTCPTSTPYYIGLAPLNVTSTTGAGTMNGVAFGDTVTYQLYSNAGLTTVWGNTATSTSVGNGVAGTGNGSAQPLTVYAKVTGSTDVRPDTYSDTVQVNVNY